MESGSWRAGQCVIYEAAALAGDERVSGGREFLARAREGFCVGQDEDTYP
jgi:hypothetical protein